MSVSDREEAQRERALKAWHLVVLDPADPEILATLRRILRVKRFELPALAQTLPGTVRRGARADLAPLEEALTGAGVRCELRRSSD